MVADKDEASETDGFNESNSSCSGFSNDSLTVLSVIGETG